MTGASLSHAWFTVLFKLVSSWRTSFSLLDESQTNCNKEMGKKESHGLLKLLLRVQKPGEAIKHLSTNSSLIGLINPVHN